MPSPSGGVIPSPGTGSTQPGEDIAFVPLAIPLMFGPGALATVLGMSSLVKQSGSELASFAAICLAIAAPMFVTCICIALIRALGSRSVRIHDCFAVFVKKADAPPSADETETVALAPKGAKPGLIVADTQVVTAKIEAVNYRKRTVTLKGPEGQTRILKVGSNVKNFKEVKKGDEVVVRFTEALVILVEKSR